MSRQTPYIGLREAARKYRFAVQYPQRKTVWRIKKPDLTESSYLMLETAHKVATAELFGYRTELVVTNEGNLECVFVKNPPKYLDWNID